MNFLVGKGLTLLLLFLIAHTSAFISQEFLNDLKNSIQVNFKNRSPQRLSNLFYAIKTFQITNQPLDQLISNNSICRFLNDLPFHEVEIESLVFEYFYLRENFQCYGLDISQVSHILKFLFSTSQDIDNFMIKVRTESHLNDLRAAIYFSSTQKHQKHINYKFLCQKLADELTEFNENTFNDPKTKVSQGTSFFTAEIIFESYSICQKMNMATSRLDQQLDKFSSMVLNNLTPLRKNWRLAAKNDFFTNANLFFWIFNLRPSLVSNNYKVYYAQLVHSDKVFPTSTKEIFDVFRLSQELKYIPILSLIAETIDDNSERQLTIQVSDIFRRESFFEISTTNFKFSFVNEKQQILPKIKSQIQNNNITLSINPKSISEFGPHQLKVQIVLTDSTIFDYQIPVIIKEQIHLNYLRVGFSNNSLYPSSQKQKTEIGYHQRLTKDINIDQNRYFHVEFRLGQDIKTDFIAINVRRIDSESSPIETLLMKKDPDSKLWRAVIDFKNRTCHSDEIYRLELVISGKLIYPIQWTFAQLHVKSSIDENQQQSMGSDLFYQPPPQKSQPSILITGFTNVLIISGLGVYFVLLKKTDVTLKDTPKNLIRKIAPILLIILIFSSITICVLFFEKITTFEILFTFLLFVVPIIVIGNMAHGALK